MEQLSGHISEKKYVNIKFYENRSSGNRFVPCVLTEGTDRQDMMKLVVDCRSFAKAPKTTYVQFSHEFDLDYPKLRDKQMCETINCYLTYSAGTD